MRTLLKFSMHVESANKAIKENKLQELVDSLNNTLRPEACYFYAENGKRTGLMIFDLKNPSDIPSIAEPLFHALNAEVTFCPCMNLADVKSGLEKAMRTLEREPVGVR